MEQSAEQGEVATASLDKKLPRRYKVNVLVSRKESEFPIVVEENPNYHSLFGYVETATFKGTVFTDFSLIRPGSFAQSQWWRITDGCTEGVGATLCVGWPQASFTGSSVKPDFA
ncbi:AAA family ATPase [Vibrio sinaloensis]|nr:AAA family ATPase [Vibrio sinaloensis]